MWEFKKILFREGKSIADCEWKVKKIFWLLFYLRRESL